MDRQPTHLRFRIDAFTIFALPATGPHGFHAIGRYVASTDVCFETKYIFMKYH